MPFEPVAGQHAIFEVVFIVTFARPFSVDEISNFEQAHGKWKNLQKKSRINSIVIGIGPDLSSPPPSTVSGVQFERFKPDGSLAWRLSARDNALLVNCLVYTRWDDIWRVSRRFMKDAATALSKKGNFILNVALQYIDVFNWKGDVNLYDAKELLRYDKLQTVIPESIWNKGPLWHLHQGWFTEIRKPVQARLLDRMHIDALKSQSGYLIRFDNMLQIDFPSPLAAKTIFSGKPSKGDNLFNYLHVSNKNSLGNFLTDSMKKRIGLNA